MAQSAWCSRQMLTVLSNHGLVRLLVMLAVVRFQVSWVELCESSEEEIVVVISDREEESVSLVDLAEEE